MDRLVSFKSFNITLLGMCICMVCGILFGIIFFRIIGAENFGIYGAVQLLLAFYLLLEFSVGPFLIRELSSSISSKTGKRVNYIFFGLFVGTTVAIFAAVSYYMTAVFIFSVFSPEKSIEVEPLVLSSSWLLFCIMVQLIISSFFNGLQLQHLAMTSNAIVWCLRIILGVLFIDHVNPDIGTLINTHLVSIIAVIFMQLTYLKSKYSIKISIKSVEITYNEFSSIFNEYLDFSRKYYIATLLGFLCSSIDKIVFLRLMGSYEFGCYTLAKNISTGLGSIIQAVVSHAYPTLTSKMGHHKELFGTIYIYQAILLILIAPILAFILSAPEYLMTFYSGNAESGVLISKYSIFLVFGVFFSGAAALIQTLLVASGNEKFILWINILMLCLIGGVFGIGEFIGLSNDQNKLQFTTILLITFAVSPLVSIAMSLVAERQKLILNTFKTITAPLWCVVMPLLLFALFSKTIVGGSDLLRAIGIYVFILILCGFLVWCLRACINGENLGLKKLSDN